MGKKSVVVEIMEKRLSPYGFHYAAYEGYRWTFSREVEGVIQSIVIQRSHWGKDYTLEIDAGYRSCRPKEITNDPEYNLDFLDFNSEEEQRTALNRLLDVVEKYGMNKLEELTQEARTKVEPLKPTAHMYKKLYEENSVLTQQFLLQNNAIDLTEEDILLLLKKELEEIHGEMYEDIQNKLVELASVYGNMLIKKVGGRWIYTKGDGRTSLEIPLFSENIVLENFIEAWQKGEDGLIIDKYNDKCSRIIDWVRECRRLYGEDWQSKSSYAKCKYKIPSL